MSRDGHAVTAVDMEMCAEPTFYSNCTGYLVAAARAALNIEPGEELDEQERELLCRALRMALDAIVAKDEKQPSVHVLFESDEDKDRVTIAELIKSNQDCPIKEAKLLALTLCRVGDKVPFGGGATPLVTLTRIR